VGAPIIQPMGRRVQLSARQYVGLALLGSLLLACSFVADLPIDHWFPAASRLTSVLVMLPFFAIGTPLMLIAESRFRDGIQNGIWSEAEIVRLRAVLTSPFLTVICIAMLIAGIIVVFVAHHHYRGISWVLLIMGQSFTRLQMAFRPPTPKNPRSLLSWSNLSPIQSEHWGER